MANEAKEFPFVTKVREAIRSLRDRLRTQQEPAGVEELVSDAEKACQEIIRELTASRILRTGIVVVESEKVKRCLACQATAMRTEKLVHNRLLDDKPCPVKHYNTVMGIDI